MLRLQCPGPCHHHNSDHRTRMPAASESMSAVPGPGPVESLLLVTDLRLGQAVVAVAGIIVTSNHHAARTDSMTRSGPGPHRHRGTPRPGFHCGPGPGPHHELRPDRAAHTLARFKPGPDSCRRPTAAAAHRQASSHGACQPVHGRVPLAASVSATTGMILIGRPRAQANPGSSARGPADSPTRNHGP
jgi:hypothetical protein